MGSLQEARQALASAGKVAALTGAGISAESGIPTFRGAQGLWKNFRAGELATPEAFARDPEMVWEWYDWRRQLIAEAKPNPGHIALAEFARRCELFTLITQNVDGLHDLAGSTGILKIHGDIWVLRCTGCGVEALDRRAPLPQLPPVCPLCKAMQRPGVGWFGEALPQDVWQKAERAALEADILLVVGTSALVYPAASLVPAAKRAGARAKGAHSRANGAHSTIIEINIERGGASGHVDWFLEGPSGEILPELLSTA